MSHAAPGKIHQASDLNRSYRAILAEARGGHALVRDTDGVGLVILPSERFAALEAISAATANFVRVERTVMHTETATSHPDAAQLGEWTWLRVFDSEDIAEFLQELSDALLYAAHEQDSRTLVDVITAWKTTARALSDETRRDILLGAVADSDFVEVTRPTELDEHVAMEA